MSYVQTVYSELDTNSVFGKAFNFKSGSTILSYRVKGHDSVIVYFPVYGHAQCYKCSTTKDWDKCDDIKKKQSCSSLLTKCLKAEIHIEGNGVYEDGYVKMCALPTMCSAKTLPNCNSKAEGWFLHVRDR